MFSHKTTKKNYNNENSEIKELKEKIDNLIDKINMYVFSQNNYEELQ